MSDVHQLVFGHCQRESGQITCTEHIWDICAHVLPGGGTEEEERSSTEQKTHSFSCHHRGNTCWREMSVAHKLKIKAQRDVFTTKGRPTLSTITSFFGFICILVPCRNAELGMLPVDQRKEMKAKYVEAVVFGLSCKESDKP